jgi:hypothetical protein
MSTLRPSEGSLRRASPWILLFALVVLAFAPLLVSAGFVVQGDFWFPLNADALIATLWPLWNPRGSLPTFPSLMRLPFAAASLVFTAFQGSTSWYTRVLPPFAFFLAGGTMLVWARRLLVRAFPDASPRAIWIGSLFAAAFYAFNPWTFNRIEHYFMLVGYALLPAALFFVDRAVRRGRPKDGFLAAATWTMAATTPFLAVALFLLVLSWATLQAWDEWKRRSDGTIRVFARFGAVSLAMAAFSLFWSFPVLASLWLGAGFAPVYVVTRDSVGFLASAATPWNVARLVGYWRPLAPYSFPGAYESLWALVSLAPLVVLLGSLRFWPNRVARWHAGWAFLAGLLSMGANPYNPFRGAYEWLLFDAPLLRDFGWVFREPERWSGLLAYAYAFFVGTAALRLWEGAGSRVLERFARVPSSLSRRVPVVVLAVLLVAYAAPLAANHPYGGYAPVAVPAGWQTAEAVLAQVDGAPSSSKALWLPRLLEAETSWAPGRLVNEVDAVSSPIPAWSSQTVAGSAFYAFLAEEVLHNRRTDRVGGFLTAADIGYLVARDDVVGIEDAVGYYHLEDQMDLALVSTADGYAVYAVTTPSTRTAVHRAFVALVGGGDGLLTLTAFTARPLASTAAFLASQTMALPAPDVVVVTKADWILDMALARGALSGELVIPFQFTTVSDPDRAWSVATTWDRLHAPWHPELRDRGLRNWEHDFGVGLVATSLPGANLDLGEAPAIADVYVRYLVSPKGGTLALTSGGEDLIWSSREATTEFRWYVRRNVSLGDGARLVLRNVEGFNAANLVVLAPASSSRPEAALQAELDTTPVAFLWEAESVFASRNGLPERSDGASNGAVLSFRRGGEADVSFALLSRATYRLLLRADVPGGLEVEIDGNRLPLVLKEPGSWESRPISLAEGSHRLVVGADDGTFDAAYLVPGNDPESFRALLDTRAPAADWRVVRSTPAQAEVTTTREGRIVIVLAESFDPLWRVETTAGSASALPAYLAVNGFVVERVEASESVRLVYAAQSAAEAGLVASIVAVIFAATYAFVPPFRSALLLAVKRRRRR